MAPIMKNKAEETIPWANIKNIAPCNPWILHVNNPIIAIFMCATDEYAIIRFKSIWRIAVSEAKITLIKQNRLITGKKK